MLRRRFLALIAFAGVSGPAAAEVEIPPDQDGGADRPLLLRFGASFQPIANAFGCGQFRWAAFGRGKQSMTFEFLPLGADLKGWTRMLTTTVYPLPVDPAAQQEAMRQRIAGLLGAYGKGKILDQEHYVTQNGEPRLFIDYEIGEGLLKEHNAGAFVRAGTSSAAFVQIQSHGAAPLPKDAADMKLLAQGRLSLPSG